MLGLRWGRRGLRGRLTGLLWDREGLLVFLVVLLGVRSGLRTRRAGEGLRNVKTGGREGRTGLRGRLGRLPADVSVPLAATVESLADRDERRRRLAELEVDLDELPQAGGVPGARDDRFRPSVARVAFRTRRDGLRVGLDGCLQSLWLVRLARLCGGLKLRVRGTGTGLEARRTTAAEFR